MLAVGCSVSLSVTSESTAAASIGAAVCAIVMPGQSDVTASRSAAPATGCAGSAYAVLKCRNRLVAVSKSQAMIVQDSCLRMETPFLFVAPHLPLLKSKIWTTGSDIHATTVMVLHDAGTIRKTNQLVNKHSGIVIILNFVKPTITVRSH